MLDLGLEDFDIDRALGFTEVSLQYFVADLSCFNLFLRVIVLNDTARLYLIFVNWVHLAEELEDFLSVEGLSRCKVATQRILSTRHQVDLSIMANLHVPDTSQVQQCRHVLLQEVADGPIIASKKEFRTIGIAIDVNVGAVAFKSELSSLKREHGEVCNVFGLKDAMVAFSLFYDLVID